MTRIHISNAAYTRLETKVWLTATDSDFAPPWWQVVTPLEDAGKLFVAVDDPDDPGVDGRCLRRMFTKRELVTAYLEIDNPTHCGGYSILEEPDACGFDLLLQHAMFGEIVFA